MTLEKKLVRLRKKEGMSQADVSEKLDVSRQAVSRWEAGDSRPSTENLQALCKLYNVKLDDLLSDSDEELPIGQTDPIKTECELEQKSKERNRVWIKRGVIAALILALIGLDDWIVLLSERVYLKSASSTTDATPFAAFTLDPYKMGTQIRAYATSLSASETCNIGFSNYSSGKSLASAVNLGEYDTLELYVGVGKPTIGVRASTYSNPGWSTIEVDGAYRVTNIR